MEKQRKYRSDRATEEQLNDTRQRVRDAMGLAEITAPTLARSLSINTSTLYNFLNGKAGLALETNDRLNAWAEEVEILARKPLAEKKPSTRRPQDLHLHAEAERIALAATALEEWACAKLAYAMEGRGFGFLLGSGGGFRWRGSEMTHPDLHEGRSMFGSYTRADLERLVIAACWGAPPRREICLNSPPRPGCAMPTGPLWSVIRGLVAEGSEVNDLLVGFRLKEAAPEHMDEFRRVHDFSPTSSEASAGPVRPCSRNSPRSTPTS